MGRANTAIDEQAFEEFVASAEGRKFSCEELAFVRSAGIEIHERTGTIVTSAGYESIRLALVNGHKPGIAKVADSRFSQQNLRRASSA